MEQKSNAFLETESVGALMRRYAIPCITSLLVGALYNIVDQIFIANASYLGSYGNAANTVVFPLTVVALAIAVMIGDGCCAFVSISLGKGEVGAAKKSVGNAVVLAVALAVSLFNPLLCVLATVANPVIGLLYTFFFSNTIGKNLTRAVLSAALLCILFYGMDYYGFSVISIQTDALLKYSPFALALLGVWYVYDSAL